MIGFVRDGELYYYPARIRMRVSVSGGYGYGNTVFYEKIRYVIRFIILKKYKINKMTQ
jgi:hypothetical protein